MSNEEFDLTLEQCGACHKGSSKATDHEVEELMPHVPGWEIVEVDDVPRPRRTYKFKGWTPAVAFVNKVADIAEETDHHPRIMLDWGEVQIDWWTHAIRGLHRNDFIMAAKTNEIDA